VLRRLKGAAIWRLCAAALVVAPILYVRDSRSQSPGTTDPLSATPDSDPADQLRLRRSPAEGRDANPTRAGTVPTFSYQPGTGAGSSGFDSTNAAKRKPKSGDDKSSTNKGSANKGGAKSKAGSATKPPPRTLTDAAGRAETPGGTGAPAVNQPIGEARLPQHRDRRGAPPAGVFASAPLADPGAAPLRRLPLVEVNPFDPIGVNVGAFRLRPALELSSGYDSLPSRTINGRASWYAVVAPELLVNSNWVRHEVTATIRGSYTDYFQTPELTRPALDAKVTGRLDVTRDTRLLFDANFLLGTDNPGSPNIQADLRRLPIFLTAGGSAGLAQRFNRLDVTVRAIADRTVYQQSTFVNGAVESNDDRNFNRYGSELRTSYEVTPGIKPFVEFGADQRVHDLTIDRSGLMRDSHGGYAKAGTSFEFTRLLTGEMSLGYLTRTYRDPTLPDLAGLLVDGSLVWTATPLTTFKLIARTTANETTVAGVSGIFTREAGLEAAHAFRRWLIATLRFTAGLDTYQGSPRVDERYAASLGVAYALNPYMQLKSEFRQEWRHSNQPGGDYTASVLLFGARLQR
jgi:hypothetical protein